MVNIYYRLKDMRKQVKKTTLQIDLALYKRLIPMRRPGTVSIGRLEPIQNVIERLLDFYIEKGGELPHSL